MAWSLKNDRRTRWTSGLVLGLISTAVHFIALNQTPYANGWDGYYYVMQAHSFIEYGHLQSLDYSLIYPYYISLSYLIPDYELAFQIGTALVAGVFTSVTFGVICGYSQKICLAILGGALTIFSPGITFFVSQFPKNLLGLIFLLVAAYYILRQRHWQSIVFVLLSFLTHRMTGALGIIFLLLSVMHKVSWKYVAGVALVLAILSFLPGILGISDLERFEGAFSAYPQLAPLSFLQSDIVKGNVLWTMEIIAGILLLAYHAYWFIRRFIKEKQISLEGLLFLSIFMIILFPFFKMAHGSMGFRFFLLLPFATLFLVVFALRNVKEKSLLIVSLALIVSSEFSYKAYNPMFHDAPNSLYMQITSSIQEQYSPEKYALVIAHKSLAEVIIFKTEFDALNWAVPSDMESEQVLRVVHGIPDRILRRYLAGDRKDLVLRIDANYCIMPEQLWAMILADAAQDGQFMTLVRNGNNPLQPRPQYLLKGKSS